MHGELRRRRRAVAHADVVIIVVHRFVRNAKLWISVVPHACANTCPNAGANALAKCGTDKCTNTRAYESAHSFANEGANSCTDAIADAVSHAGADAGSRGL